MSGLEPLVALGLACNILQLCEVGVNTIKLVNDVYQSNSPTVFQVLQDNAAILNIITNEVKAAPQPASLSILDQQLVTTAHKCSVAARDLEEETKFLISNAKQGKLVATLKGSANPKWRQRRLDRLRDNLENAEKLMTKTLLAQVWSRTGAAELDLSKVTDHLREFIIQYQSGTRDIKQLVSSENLLTREHLSAWSQKTLEAIDGVQKQVTKLTVEADVQVDQAQRERLLRSLKFPAFNERRNQLSEAHNSTFEWIFIGDDGPSQEDAEESNLKDIDLAYPSEAIWDSFSNWLSSTAVVYWISGKPGSGKTTLVNYVLSHPKTITYLNTWSPHALTISHFFWRPGSPMQRNIKGLLCSLLYQLLASSEFVLAAVQAPLLDMKFKHTDWSVPELRSICLQILSSYERPICIFLDGLDEVDPSDGALELLDLVLQFSRCRDVKLCLSSRPEPILEQRLSIHPHLRLQHLNRPDLERYARDHMKLARSPFGEADMDPIELLVEKSEGVFLWLILAINSINKGFLNGDTAGMIRRRIQCLPADLARLYEDMWDRACKDSPQKHRRIAARYLRLILLGQDCAEGSESFSPSLLHLTLASTSLGDQLLEATDDPDQLLTEERLVEACRNVQRQLELYCFGLVEITHSSHGDDVVGWYDSHYDTLWSQYGRARLDFIHRTAQSFLLDTVDGFEILGHDTTTDTSLFFAWARGHLAMSQLFASKSSSMTNNVLDYVFIFDRFPREVTRSDHPDRSRTISYLEKLCNSGQLLSNSGGKKRLCGGVDFLKAAARIHDEFILPRRRISTLSKATISAILLNVAETPPGRDPTHCKHSADPLIMMLLSEGADPNSHGSTFYAEGRGPFGFSDIQTPFTAYLNAMMINERRLHEMGPIARLMRNLHLFLSHSANLGDKIHQVFCYETHKDRAVDAYHWQGSVQEALGERGTVPTQEGLLVAFQTCTVVEALLDSLAAEVQYLRHVKDPAHGELASLLHKSYAYLDKWPKWEDSHVIGKLTYEEIEAPIQNSSTHQRVWYAPAEANPSGVTNELMEILRKCLLYEVTDYSSGTCQVVRQLVGQISWTPRANGLREAAESLAQLGILAASEHETHEIQACVGQFQERLLSGRRTVDRTVYDCNCQWWMDKHEAWLVPREKKPLQNELGKAKLQQSHQPQVSVAERATTRATMDRTRLAKWLEYCLEAGVWRSSHQSRATEPIEIEIDPQPLFDCIEDQLGDKGISQDQEHVSRAIEQIIILTGAHQHAFAATAREYVEMHWANSTFCSDALKILKSLSVLFIKRTSEVEVLQPVVGSDGGVFGTWRLPSAATDSKERRKCIFSINDSTVQSTADTLQLLAWISEALRIPCEENDPEIYSQPETPTTTLYLGNRFERFAIQFCPQEPLSTTIRDQQAVGCCWNRTFSHFSIATSFPIRTGRSEGFAGVEAPLNLVALLTQLDYPLQYMEGFVLKGQRAALIPLECVRVAGKVTQVQWHLVESEPSNSCPLSMSEVPELKTVLSISSIDEFSRLISDSDIRHFVGLYQKAELNFGTGKRRVPSLSSVTRLRGQGVEYRSEWSAGWQRTLSPSVSMGIPGVISLGTSSPFNLDQIHLGGKCRRAIESKDTIWTMIESACENLTLLYDVGTQTAWLIPEICVVFHLLKAFLAQEANTNNRIAFPTSDQIGLGLAASKEHCKVFVRKLPSEHQDRLELFLKAFQQMKEDICFKPRGTSRSEILRRFTSHEKYDRLCGADLHQLSKLGPGGKYTLFEVRINKEKGGQWVQMLESNWDQAVTYSKKGCDGKGLKVVSLLCDNLTGSPPIEPATGFRHCRSWFPVPQRNDYLITTIQCLQHLNQLYPVESGRISPKHWFVIGHIAPFEFYPCRAGGSCDRLQQIRLRGNLPGTLLVRGDEFLKQQSQAGVGAIIFGNIACGKHTGTRKTCKLETFARASQDALEDEEDIYGVSDQEHGQNGVAGPASPHLPQPTVQSPQAPPEDSASTPLSHR